MSHVWIITKHTEYEGFSIEAVCATEFLARRWVWENVEVNVIKNLEESPESKYRVYVETFYELNADGKDYLHDTVFEETEGVDTWYLVREHGGRLLRCADVIGKHVWRCRKCKTRFYQRPRDWKKIGERKVAELRARYATLKVARS